MSASTQIKPHLGKQVRVQLIDDSAVVRGLTRRWLTGLDDIEIVAVSVDGAQGVADAGQCRPDVIILDVEMPRMDGLEALPHLRRAAPKAKILMASTLTHKGANTTIQALSRGATDYLPKPEAGQIGGADQYRDNLIEKIRFLGVPDLARAPALPAQPLRPFAPRPEARSNPNSAQPTAPAPGRPALRPLPLTWKRPDAIVVGSSTGGPQALQAVLPELTKHTHLPIFVVQHMPATFTEMLAKHLDESCDHMVVEAKHGQPVAPRHTYIAPGGFHMVIERRNGSPVIELNQDAQVNFCRPAVDVMFDSAAKVFGGALAAVILTGMGSDGTNGVGAILEKGGRTFIQDQQSSVVWGMPGSVFNAGFAHSQHTLDEIAPAVEKFLRGAR